MISFIILFLLVLVNCIIKSISFRLGIVILYCSSCVVLSLATKKLVNPH